MMRRFAPVMLFASAGCHHAPPARSTPVLWAWERPEDLRIAGPVEVAVESGSVLLDGDAAVARGRRFPLLMSGTPSTSVVHVEIVRDRPLVWSPALRAAASAAILHYATRIPTPRVQLDLEVRASERPVLLALLADLRRSLPRGTALSMTALASWCGEDWLAGAPVDEVVPMLFRMGPGGNGVRATLAAGGDLGHPRCRTALGVALGAPRVRVPLGRRLYVFDPRSWTRGDVAAARRLAEGR